MGLGFNEEYGYTYGEASKEPKLTPFSGMKNIYIHQPGEQQVTELGFPDWKKQNNMTVGFAGRNGGDRVNNIIKNYGRALYGRRNGPANTKNQARQFSVLKKDYNEMINRNDNKLDAIKERAKAEIKLDTLYRNTKKFEAWREANGIDVPDY